MSDISKNETFRIFATSSIVLCICISMLMAMFALAVWNFNQPPRAYYLADSLQKGMSKQEVQKILGSPNNNHGDTYAYNRPFAWGIYYVIFDGEEKLIEHYYDP